MDRYDEQFIMSLDAAVIKLVDWKDFQRDDGTVDAQKFFEWLKSRLMAANYGMEDARADFLARSVCFDLAQAGYF